MIDRHRAQQLRRESSAPRRQLARVGLEEDDDESDRAAEHRKLDISDPKTCWLLQSIPSERVGVSVDWRPSLDDELKVRRGDGRTETRDENRGDSSEVVGVVYDGERRVTVRVGCLGGDGAELKNCNTDCE